MLFWKYRWSNVDINDVGSSIHPRFCLNSICFVKGHKMKSCNTNFFYWNKCYFRWKAAKVLASYRNLHNRPRYAECFWAGRICIVSRLLLHGASVFCCLVQWTVTISMSVYYGMQGEKLFYRTWNPNLHVVLELIYIALLNYHKSVKRAYFKFSPTSVNTFLDSCGFIYICT